MQRIDIIGHVGQDAEIKDFNNNHVINFSVAVSESYTNQQGEKITNTTWYECAKWGNQTQIANFLKKGQLVFVTGKPQARAWLNKDGNPVSNLGINVFEIKLLGAQKTENNNSSTTQSSPISNNQSASSSNEDEHDDLPF